jgi:hypothetical protein
VPATVKLTRQAPFAIELRRGTFDVVVDGKPAEPIEPHETTETPVEPGRHTLRVRHGRYSSRDISFDAADGEVISLRCHGANLWPIWLVSFAVPNLAISLRRE